MAVTVGISQQQHLIEAVSTHNAPLVKELLGQLEEESLREQWLLEALLRTVYENKADSVRTLLEVGAKPSGTDDLGRTPLHWAAGQAHEGIVRNLLERNASAMARAQDGSTPLHQAASSKITASGAVAKVLLARGCDALALDEQKRTALHVAAEQGAAIVAAVLLDAKELQTDESTVSPLLELLNEKGESALARAAFRGHGDVAHVLLRKGAKVRTGNWWGQTPLHLAASNGHVGAAGVLIDASAEVNAAATDGSTPLFCAAQKGHIQVIELLAAHAADPQARGPMGQTPLHAAAEKGFEKAANGLLMHKADVDSRSDENRTPLSYAAQRGHVEVARRLLDGKADPQALDSLFQTPLHAAAQAGRSEAGDLIVNRRARVEQQDAAGRTPLQLALEGKQDGMIRVLLRNGAELPEEFKDAPELQPIIRDVEHELIQMQMQQRDSGKDGHKELQVAEQEFEQARLKLLTLSKDNTLNRAAPALHHLELRKHDAKEDVKAKCVQKAMLEDQMKRSDDEFTKTTKEADAQKKALRMLRQDLSDLRTDFNKKSDELKGIKREIDEAREAAATAKAKEAASRESVAIAQQKQEEVSAQHGVMVEENRQLREQLAGIQDQLNKWHAEKEEAVALHLKAQEILLRSPQAAGGYSMKDSVAAAVSEPTAEALAAGGGTEPSAST